MPEERNRPTILIVDDDPVVVHSLAAILESGYRLKVATSGSQGLQLARTEPLPDLILLDILLPEIDGREVCRHLKSDPQTREIPVILISSLSGAEDECVGFALGAEDYIAKPFSAPVVKARVATHVALYDQRRHLEHLVSKRTAELRQSQLEIVRRLGRAAEYKDNETGYHVIRMSIYTRLLAVSAGLPEKEAELLHQAAAMHDVGKIGIPDHILTKPGPLDRTEWALMQRHTEFGADIIGVSDIPLLRIAREVALHHHERWDGKGYPGGLKEEEIPLSARIVAICDVYDALCSERPYKRPWPPEDAADYIRKNSGSHFDPGLTELFRKVLPEILEVSARYRDDPQAGGTC